MPKPKHMKLSLNGAGLGAGKLSFLEFADLAARHGFDGVDFGIGAAISAAETLGGISGLLDALKEKNIGLADKLSFERDAQGQTIKPLNAGGEGSCVHGPLSPAGTGIV